MPHPPYPPPYYGLPQRKAGLGTAGIIGLVCLVVVGALLAIFIAASVEALHTANAAATADAPRHAPLAVGSSGTVTSTSNQLQEVTIESISGSEPYFNGRLYVLRVIIANRGTMGIEPGYWQLFTADKHS